MGLEKRKEVIEDFIKYCEENPGMRFWQAARNWSGCNYVFAGKGIPIIDEEFELMKKLELQDTFYWENKNN